MELNKIFELKDYESAYDYAMTYGYTIKEIDSDGETRKFQIVEQPKLSEDEVLNVLRSRREFECFSIINRGALWYEGINVEQYLELQKWYKEWLDVTTTKNIPQRPNWLK